MAKRTTKRTRAAGDKKIDLEAALAWLEKKGTKKQVKELDRYGITAHDPFGVTVGDLRRYAKTFGTDMSLARELWANGRYEARMLAIFVADPEVITLREMNQWAGDFDNWALVDTACFSLFDRTKHAWKRAEQWAKAKPEYKKRTGFAMVWSLSTHDKEAPDQAFLSALDWIESAAEDDRNFVKKAVDMALRAIGKRNIALNTAAIRTAKRLAKSEDATARWIGKHSLREIDAAPLKKKLRSR